MEESVYIEPALDKPSEYVPMLEHVRECFAMNAAFLERMGFELPTPTQQDRMEAMQIYHATPDAPPRPTTLASAMVLEKMLNKHDYVLQDTSNKMRNYVVFKLFEHAESDDPKVSLKALEYLAKSSDVGLFAERVEININQKSTVELESDLTSLLTSIVKRTTLPSANAVDAEFSSI